MSPVFRTLADLTPAQRRRIKILPSDLRIEWSVRVIMGGYQEPRPSEQRHHWIKEHNRFAPAGYVVMCARCACVMQRTGRHPRLCRGTRGIS